MEVSEEARAAPHPQRGAARGIRQANRMWPWDGLNGRAIDTTPERTLTESEKEDSLGRD
jgi:hypothetical protein